MEELGGRDYRRISPDSGSLFQTFPKGLYRKARLGELLKMTGIDSPYEEPEHPNLRVDTTGRAVEQVVHEIYAHLQAIKFIADDSQDGF